jgi:hypothetical protein
MGIYTSPVIVAAWLLCNADMSLDDIIKLFSTRRFMQKKSVGSREVFVFDSLYLLEKLIEIDDAKKLIGKCPPHITALNFNAKKMIQSQTGFAIYLGTTADSQNHAMASVDTIINMVEDGAQPLRENIIATIIDMPPVRDYAVESLEKYFELAKDYMNTAHRLNRGVLFVANSPQAKKRALHVIMAWLLCDAGMSAEDAEAAMLGSGMSVTPTSRQILTYLNTRKIAKGTC